jgi:heat shock protein HtpX
MAVLYNQISANRRNSLLIIAFFIALVFGLCFVFTEVIGVYSGNSSLGFVMLPVFLIPAAASAVGGYYYSDKIVLGLSGARPAEKSEFPHLVNVVEGLSIAAGIPMPKVYVIDDPAPNAFATGRDPKNSAIAVTTGLLKIMDRYELEGVIAHEMSHVKNYDIRLATLAVVMVGFISILSDFMLRSFAFRGGRGGKKNEGAAVLIIALVLAILAPIFAQLVRLALSRKREYLADADGALLTRYPEGLANALEKISKDQNQLLRANDATAPLYISSPFKGKLLSGLLSTHPPIEDRIRILRSM